MSFIFYNKYVCNGLSHNSVITKVIYFKWSEGVLFRYLGNIYLCGFRFSAKAVFWIFIFNSVWPKQIQKKPVHSKSFQSITWGFLCSVMCYLWQQHFQTTEDFNDWERERRRKYIWWTAAFSFMHALFCT